MAKKKKVDASEVIPVEAIGPELISMGKHEGTLGVYELFGIDDGEGNAVPLVETDTFKLAVVKHPSGQLGMAKVNATEEAIEAIKTEARVLRTLQQVAAKVDADAFSKAEVPPNHGAFFPNVVETIEEEGKYVLLLSYHPSITTFKQLKPLSMVLEDGRIDLKSATWLMGKLLKTLGFVHALGFTVGNIDASAILLETEVHGALFFDFSQVNEDPDEEEQRAEVAQLAEVIWQAVGGTAEAPPPHDEELLDIVLFAEYCSFLSRVKSGETDGADAEYAFVYTEDEGLADRCWPRKEKSEGGITILKRDFHTFVTYPA
jgi:hypothetical protein